MAEHISLVSVNWKRLWSVMFCIAVRVQSLFSLTMDEVGDNFGVSQLRDIKLIHLERLLHKHKDL